MDVVALGELLIDFTENGVSGQGNPLFEANPGGAPCNVLAMLSRLGHRTAFIGKVGNDFFGKQLEDAITEVGIDAAGLLKDDKVHTTLALVHTYSDGDRDFSFYRNPGADMMLTEEELPEEIIRGAKIFHFGTLSMTHPGVRAATKKAIAVAKEAGALISFDPNIRKPLWDSMEDAREQVLYGLGQCDILKISDNEIQWLTGKEDYTDGVRWIRERYPVPLILVSMGKEGSRAMMENLQQTQQVLETNTGNLNQLMKQNSAYAEDNSAATQELAAGMEETSANAAHIVENVGIMRESSDNIQRLAEDGEKNSGQIQERAGEMERISTESRHKTDQMYAVMKQKTDAAVEQAKSVQKINALTDNIKQISSQTNLLALNANIEAARAGEAGRGFAVVASEIGDLAPQTLDTVSTIDEIVGEVNSSVSNMTECLTTIMEFLEQTVLGDYEHFAQVGEQYHADADTFQQIMQQTKEAVDALEQHIGEISSTVSEINSMVEQSTDGISGIAEKSGSTQNLVTEGYDKLQECTQSVNVIRDFVAQFHLD